MLRYYFLIDNDMIDQIIDFNQQFVEKKGYEKYITDKSSCGDLS